MTSPASPAAGSPTPPPPPDTVGLTIDGVQVRVAKGTLVIRAAEQIGVHIPRFCDHPLLDPVGACRQCLVDVGTPRPDGTLGWLPKPQAACTTVVSDGMEVKTQHSSAVADKAQHGVMELLLINHPLDCPVCDKGGECPLQNQAMSNGRAVSRFEDVKRTFPKPIAISTEVLLDRERCIVCQRCTRFSDQIAGDRFISLVERGAMQQIGIYQDEPFESYFSGNTIQICPVGALTSAAYRFRSRPFDLVSTVSTCEHCASGCSLRTDHRRGVVLRKMAWADPDVNEEWNCDKGRWAFAYPTLPDRLTMPMVRQPDGELAVVGWPEALEFAAAGLRRGRNAGVLVGGRVSVQDAYAYAKFARLALRTNDVDFRARPHSAEEMDFLARRVVGVTPDSGGVDYAALEQASTVVLVGLEPEEESPIVFLRLRTSARAGRVQVYALAPFASRGLTKLRATVLPTVPGSEPQVLAALGDTPVGADLAARLGPEAVVLVGERLAAIPGALAAVTKLVDATGARLAWVPRRAGDRGALEAGAVPALLPGGRPVADSGARAEMAALWQVDDLPGTPGRDAAGILQAAASGWLGALVVGGVDPGDMGASEAHAALEQAFVVSLEVRESPVTRYADVVLPVAPHDEKSGEYLNWEGRVRPFDAALTSNAMSDHRVLDMLAAELGIVMETRTQAQIATEWGRLAPWQGRPLGASGAAPVLRGLPNGDHVLASWPTLLDLGRLQDGEPFLAGTAPTAVVRLSPASARALGVDEGELVTVTGPDGAITAPAAITPDMVATTVWVPANSAGAQARRTLGADPGGRVTVTKGGAA